MDRQQGNWPFVWGVIGGIAQVTERVWLGTGVTCPTVRIHPAIIAQAAATARADAGPLPARGRDRREPERAHPRRPLARDRRAPGVLDEAIEVMRLLWQGGMQSWRGRHYTVEQARIYSLPDEPPDVFVAASGPKSIELAGRSVTATSASRRRRRTSRIQAGRRRRQAGRARSRSARRSRRTRP